MQSRLVLSLLLAAITLVSSYSNDLVQATPEYQDQFSPTCSQSLEVQQTTTQNPDEVSRRTMTGMELIRGSLPVNRGTHGISKLFANALRNFFVHPESLRRRNKRSSGASVILRAIFRPPPVVKPEDPEPRPSPNPTNLPVKVTTSPTARSNRVEVTSQAPKTTSEIVNASKSNKGLVVPEIVLDSTTKMEEDWKESSLTQVSEGSVFNSSRCTFLGLLTFLCLIW